MKEWYKKHSYIPKDGKIDETVLVGRIVLSVCVVVLCLVAMGVTAFAYFSYDVTSGSNVIKAANFDVAVTVDGVPVDITNGNQRAAVMLAARESGHTITIQRKSSSTAGTGFCIVTIGNTVYHTQQIGREAMSFTVQVSVDTPITFLGHWGTSSHYGYSDAENDPVYIVQDKLITIVPQLEAAPEPVIYIAQEGDNLTKIADVFNTTVERLQVYNELPNADYVEAGQQIRIPPADWQPPVDENKAPKDEEA